MGINFPSSPTLGQKYPASPIVGVPTYTWDGEKWTTIGGAVGSKIPVFTDGSNAMIGQLTVVTPPVALTDAASKAYVDNRVRYDAAQTLTPAQTSQARANINVTKKNYIVNGAMMVSQENGTTAVTTSNAVPADMFSINVTTGAISAQQVASATPSGSPNRLRVTVTTADAAVAAGDIVWVQHAIEGLRCADLRFGFADARTVTLQFGVKAPAGTYSVVLQNKFDNRSYVAEYIIAAGEANTDTRKSVTIVGDTTGSWAIDNTMGFAIRWGLMVGTTYQQAAGAWGTVNTIGSPNQFNFMGTNGNVFELFDVSLTEGTVAPPFQVPDYASELQACQRYYQTGFARMDGYAGAAATITSSQTCAPQMRTTPTTAVLPGGTAVGTAVLANFTINPAGPSAVMPSLGATSGAGGYIGYFSWKAVARL